MKIGELAEKAHCLAVTIRYYEKMGLLPNDKRSASNHRIYDEEDGERLRFIMHCRNHKIPLQHFMRLLDIRGGLDATAPGVRADCVARSFFPKLGIPEDPVCGSAHCQIAPYWCERLARKR